MSNRKLQIGSSEGGFALIIVMWVVVIAGLMLLGVQKAITVNLDGAYNELSSVRAHWLARAGIEQALAILEDDSTATDDMLESWYLDTDYFKEVAMLKGTFSITAEPNLGDDPRSVRYGLIDHCARVNVNTADARQLRALFELESWQISSILDWRDGNDQARVSGAEAQYYANLEYPYLIRNGQFRSIEELRLVRGIEEPVFSGEDANLNGVLDVNEDDGGASNSSYPEDNGDGQLSRGLGGLTSVYGYELNQTASGDTRTNVNTADKDTLVNNFNFTDGLAKAVTEYNANKNKNSKNSNRFSSLMDLLKVKAKQDSKNKSEDEGKVDKISVKWLAQNLDELTLTDDERLPGRINVNTASREVFMSLAKMTTNTAQAMVMRQTAGHGPASKVGDLFIDKTISEEQFKAFGEQLTVRSSIFEIHSSGRTTRGISREIVAIVDRGVSPVNILYWYQSE